MSRPAKKPQSQQLGPYLLQLISLLAASLAFTAAVTQGCVLQIEWHGRNGSRLVVQAQPQPPPSPPAGSSKSAEQDAAPPKATERR